MSVSKQRRIGPTPDDIEFRALEGDISILPTVTLHAIASLDGPAVLYGPLQAARRAVVPLWLAVHLKKKRKCHIDPPTWLTIPALEETLRQEVSDGSFSQMPRDYVEVAKVLLEVAPDDIPSPDRVRILLKGIREARQSKIRDGLQALNPTHLAMPYLSAMELNELRGFFSLAHRRLLQLDPDADLHSRIDALWLADPGKALRLAPDENDPEGAPNRLVDIVRDEMDAEAREE